MSYEKILGCYALMLLGVLAFWAAVAYIVLHFVFKMW